MNVMSARPRSAAPIRRPGLVVDGVLLLAVLAAIVLALTTDRFLTVANAKAILTSASLVGIAALGLTLITIGGSAVSLAISPSVAAVGMIFLSAQSLGLIPALVLAVACGTLITGLQGAVVGYAGANPVILTIAASFAITGIATGVSGGSTVSPTASGYDHLNATPGGVALSVYVLIALALIVEWTLRRTGFGRSLYLIGENRRAARAAGLPVGRTTAVAWVGAGALFAVTAAFTAAFNTSANVNLGGTLTFDAIAAVLAGGTAIAGGRGSALRTLAGAVLIAAASDILLLRGYSTGVQIMVKGVIVLVVVVTVHLRTRGSRA
ncbi:ABC transporter permease [Paractinoplanes brasiliensis]|uniref:Simple sugar transport system permease protein/ribose transport system permease protein n=1 Tax=Paractinoplanes brasiliensis TaxID=52695 RepID=A0A4R6JLZ9_9ACTN|nr:ABC transporter permease [Actinoplanes brasiliensis]TDO36857.1 simple sugar transport system permease protein/ribose transport system permease protein [Actinoplanes brasiliensis]GID30374.1 sugar ABC transporter permease [Actinoplanes brasiliensis]